MLPPFIIEQIRRREEREAENRRRREKRDQPRLEIPIDVNRAPPERSDEEEEPDRGVVILDLK